MANEVELITFANKTVSPVYDAIIQELYTDGGGVITGCTVTIKDANHLHITEGYGVLCGREFKIVASDIPVQLSSSGNLNGRLYLHMDLSLATDPITLLVETGSTLTPVQQDANVNTTNGVYEINLATFTVGTSAISNLQDVAPKAVKIPDALNSLNSKLEVKTDTVDGVVFSRQGNIVSIYGYGINPTALPTVPEIYRPNDTMIFPVTAIASSKLYNAYVGITSAGGMNCNYSTTYAGAPGALMGGSIYFTVSYAVN